MTRDDIIRMAREVNGYELTSTVSFSYGELDRFVDLVAAVEREECRKIAANMQFSHSLTPPHSTAYNIAAAISARGLPR